MENSDQTLADSARADDAGALAVEVGAHKTVEREVPLPDADVGAVCLAVEGEQQRGGVFGDGLGRVRRHVHYADPQAARGFDVNVVVTGATHGNEAYPRIAQCLDNCGVQPIVHKGADDISAGG